MESKAVRILVAKPGLDGHDRGAKVIAYALRDAGMEVVYTGLRRSTEEIVKAAIDEDVDAIGLSILSGSHCELVEQVVSELKSRHAGAIPLFVGGTIPAEDHEQLRKLGVRAIFTAEMELAEVIATLSREIRDQSRA